MQRQSAHIGDPVSGQHEPNHRPVREQRRADRRDGVQRIHSSLLRLRAAILSGEGVLRSLSTADSALLTASPRSAGDTDQQVD